MAIVQRLNSQKLPTKVRLMLESLYSEILTLREFCLQWDVSGCLAASLLKEDDTPSYKKLLLETLVCARSGTRPPAVPFSYSQNSYQHEVILHAVEKLRNRDGHAGNLLTLGINKMSENPSAQVCMSSSIECVFPNQHISKLQYPPWHTLLARIGDDLMLYLLTTRAMFQPASSNCYLQISGTPIYDLWPYSTPKEIAGPPKQSTVVKNNLSAETVTQVFQPDVSAHVSATMSNVSRKRVSSDADGPPPKKPHPVTVYQPVTEPLMGSGVGMDAPKKKRRKKKKSKAGKLEEEQQLGTAYNYHLDLVRKTILYAKDLRERFPQNTILCDMRKENFAPQLVHDIFTKSSPCTKSTEYKQPSITKDISELVPLINAMVKNHRKTFFKGLLNCHCPVAFPRSQALHVPVVKYSTADFCEKNWPWHHRTHKRRKLPVAQLLEQYTPYRRVFLFLRSCLRRVIPKSLLGHSHNMNVLMKNVKLVIGMGKFEKLSMGMLMKNLKVSDYSWLSKIPSHRRQVELLARWMYWLFNSYIFSILRAFFYITETTVHKNKILYYRKSLWKTLRQDAVAGYLQSGRLEPLSKPEAKLLLSSGKTLGVSCLRFLPKASSLRPILNLGRSQAMGKSINKQLDSAFQALRLEKERNPKLIGCAVFGMDELYTKLKDFSNARKQSYNKRPLFFVKVDINSCFESINPPKLFSIVKDIFSKEDEFLQRKFATIILGAGKMRRSFLREMSPLSCYIPDFVRFIQGLISQRKMHDAIIVDQVMHFQDSSQDILKNLEAHLFNNIIEIGGSYYIQREGITQGSKVSVLLCNCYYGRMEQEYLGAGPDELLIRQVDDFLFLTPDIERAKAFLDKMLAGIPEYNCTVNPSKTVVNFPCELTQVVQLPQQVWFPWCGLLLNTVTLEVSVDYSCYEGLHIGDTLSAEMSRRPGLALLQKLLVITKPKCHPIFLDHKLNSMTTIREHLYKCFLLAAMRFHHLSRKLPRTMNVCFFEKVLLSLAKFVCIEWKKLFKMHLDDLIGESLHWMVFRSFRTVLAVHQGAYQTHIRVLKRNMARLRKKMPATLCRSPNLEIPPELQKILH